MFKKARLILTASAVALLGFAGNAFPQKEQPKALTAKQAAIVPISAFTAAGDLTKLKTAVNEGLNAGLTINEIKEAMIQLYAYAGFPRALNALNVFMATLEERRAGGVNDTEGLSGAPLDANVDKNKYGRAVQSELAGGPVSGAVYDFAPAIDQFLKEHLFADIFARGVLNNIDREIVTIAALANVDGLEPQLSAHYGLGMNAGLTEVQIREIISVLSMKIGKNGGDKALNIFENMIGKKK